MCTSRPCLQRLQELAQRANLGRVRCSSRRKQCREFGKHAYKTRKVYGLAVTEGVARCPVVARIQTCILLSEPGGSARPLRNPAAQPLRVFASVLLQTPACCQRTGLYRRTPRRAQKCRASRLKCRKASCPAAPGALTIRSLGRPWCHSPTVRVDTWLLALLGADLPVFTVLPASNGNRKCHPRRS